MDKEPLEYDPGVIVLPNGDYCTDCGRWIATGTSAIYDGSSGTVRHLEGECPTTLGFQSVGDQR